MKNFVLGLLIVISMSVSFVAPMDSLSLTFGWDQEKEPLISQQKIKTAQEQVIKAVEEGEVAVVKSYLEQGGNVGAVNKNGHELVLVAVQGGHIAIVKLLLKHAAVSSTQDKDGRRLIHWAAQCGHIEIVKLLLSYGDQVDVRSKGGLEPIYWAANGGHAGIVELLLKYGARVDARNRRGSQPIHSAALGGHTATVELLIKYGAQADAQDKLGSQPIHLAAGVTLPGCLTPSLSYPATLELLIAYGADTGYLNRKTEHVKTIINILESSDFKFNELPENLTISSLFRMAAGQGKLALVKRIVSDCKLNSAAHSDALMAAAATGHLEIIQFIWENLQQEDRMEAASDALAIATTQGRINTFSYLVEQNVSPDRAGRILRILLQTRGDGMAEELSTRYQRMYNALAARQLLLISLRAQANRSVAPATELGKILWNLAHFLPQELTQIIIHFSFILTLQKAK